MTNIYYQSDCELSMLQRKRIAIIRYGAQVCSCMKSKRERYEWCH